MPFPFDLVCGLLEGLEAIELHDPPLLPPQKSKRTTDAIATWFKSHGPRIHRSDTDSVALLSCFFPEHRTDRVYGIKEPNLLKILGRSLGWGCERLGELRAWKPSSYKDLGSHVASLQRVHDASLCNNITVEEVDAVLARLASCCRFSSPDVRSRYANEDRLPAHDILGPLLRKLSSRNLKWLVRLILKRFGSVILDEQEVFRAYHFLFPHILRVRSTFEAAIALLEIPALAELPTHSGKTEELLFRKHKASYFLPHIGVKVGRPEFLKARSLKQCLEMIKNGPWSVEPKYDGEYCQIHVDLSKKSNCIQIFSKSGKDSTQDRKGLHYAIKTSLNIGNSKCGFESKCILEGELVVYCDKEKRILDFHKIRKHVSRSGSFLGTERDSPAHPHEHLMIVYYDALLIDDDNVMSKPYKERRQCLTNIVTKYTGLATTADRMTLPDTNKARFMLEAMASAITTRGEGLVLKPCDSPYLSLGVGVPGKLEGCIIKLKKDYIPGLGDSADFAVVGASYNAIDAQMSGMRDIRWTTFFIACLENKDEACRFQSRPLLRVLGRVDTVSHCLSREDTIHMCNHGYFLAEESNADQSYNTFDLHQDGIAVSLDVVFKIPFIVEVLGSGFDKLASKGYFMLRHPRVVKVHSDRSLPDVIGYEELQIMGAAAKTIPKDVAKEEEEWIERLKRQASSKGHLNFSDESASPTLTKSSISARDSRSPRKPSSAAMVRVDSSELLPGEARFARSTDTAHAACQQGHGNQVSISPVTPPSSREQIAGGGETRNGLMSQTSVSGQKRQRNETLQRISPNRANNVSAAISYTPTQLPPTPSKTPSKQQQVIASKFANAASPTSQFAELADRIPLQQLSAFPDSNRIVRTETACESKTLIDDMRYLLEDAIVCISLELVDYKWLTRCLIHHNIFQAQYRTAFITNLRFWDRELDDGLGPYDSVVQESQAYQSSQKVLLVESRMPAETQQTLNEIVDLRLAPQETIEIWDWRILEYLAEADEHVSGRELKVPGSALDKTEQDGGFGTRSVCIERYRQGHISYDQTRHRNVFVPTGHCGSPAIDETTQHSTVAVAAS